MTEQDSLFKASGRLDSSHAASLGVVTWNIQNSSRTRSWKQIEWLVGRPESDVVILTEVGRMSSAESVIDALAYHGYSTHVSNEAPTDYRVIVASRVGNVRALQTNDLSYMRHRGPVCQVELASMSLALVGLYVPSRGSKEARNVAKRAFQSAVADSLPSLVSSLSAEGPVIVAGDLNVIEPDHQPHHSVFGKWEYDFYRSFAASGLIDGFRHVNGGILEHSWYGRSGLGFRFDHLFLDETSADRLAWCQYIHEPRSLGLSDHSALAARINLAHAA